MSGVLRNLSSQALGTAAVVHSIARLPFAAPPRLGGGTTSHPVAASPAARAGGSFADAGASASQLFRPSHPMPSDSTSGTPAHPEMPHDAAPSRHPAEPIGSNELRRPSEPGRTGQLDDREIAEPPDVRLAMLDRLRELAPLVVSQPRSAIASPIVPSVAATSVDTKRDVAHDVHVTIGRIEVTAVNDRPEVQRATPRMQKRMSLDEYLARRRGARL